MSMRGRERERKEHKGRGEKTGERDGQIERLRGRGDKYAMYGFAEREV